VRKSALTILVIVLTSAGAAAQLIPSRLLKNGAG
jgi:hypothetical protein